MRLASAMKRANVKTLLFSSSATVYGIPKYLPLDKSVPRADYPCDRTKLAVEEVLKGLCRSDDGWRIGNLRYFNPVRAHESGLVGEESARRSRQLVAVCRAGANWTAGEALDLGKRL